MLLNNIELEYTEGSAELSYVLCYVLQSIATILASFKVTRGQLKMPVYTCMTVYFAGMRVVAWKESPLPYRVLFTVSHNYVLILTLCTFPRVTKHYHSSNNSYWKSRAF